MQRFLDRIWFCDSETFAQDNLWVFNKYTEPDNWQVFHNDNRGIIDFLNETDPILCGYNIKGYDLHILKGNILNYEPFALKEINDWIIEGNSPWEYPFGEWVNTPAICDLILDIVPRKSLKEIEGNLGLDITETTIPFDCPDKWTKEMFDEVLYYCKADVSALRPLFEKRIDYLQTKINIAEMGDLDPIKSMSLTNANLIAEFVGAVPFEADPNEEYTFPHYMTEERLAEINPEIIHFFNTMESKFKPDGTINEEASSSLNIDIADCPHKLGFGGLHGALEQYTEESDEDRIILLWDAFSDYPSIMLNNNRLSRAVTKPERVQEAYNKRKDSKFNPNSTVPKSEIPTLKRILNTLYGISGAKFNKCYDPLMLKSVCVDGQISLIYLITKLSENIESYKHIQSNTDGIMFSINRSDYEKTVELIREFENMTGFIMEEDRISRVIQRDVNNYIVQFENGKLKTKGTLFAALKEDNYTGNSLGITAKAIVDYFISNVSVRETIENCDDVEMYQIIAKTGSTYNGGSVHFVDGEMQQVQKVNRIFAGKDERYGVVKKVKITDVPHVTKTSAKQLGERAMSNRPNWSYGGVDEETGKHIYLVAREEFPFKDGYYIDTMSTVSDCPPHAIISNNLKISIDMIDKEWYIEHTESVITKFSHKETTKGEKEEMAKRVTSNTAEVKEVTTDVATEEVKEVTPIRVVESNDNNKEHKVLDCDTCITVERISRVRNDRILLAQKIHKMRAVIAEYPLQNDGYNSGQKYEYAKAWQYKAMLNKACLEAGVEFDVDIQKIETLDIKSSEKMHLIRIWGNVTLIDIESGFDKTYNIIADGADNLDKGLYKAETMLIKSFVQMKFLRGNDDNDVEATSNPPVTATPAPKSHKPVSIENRAAAKEEVINTPQLATADMLDAIVGAVLKIRSSYPDYLTDGSLESVNSGTITQVEAVTLFNNIEDDAEELGVEL